jgi:hypothetical protein
VCSDEKICEKSRQNIGGAAGCVIPLSVSRRGRPVGRRTDNGAELVNGRDRFERARHHLSRARSMRFFGQPAFEQLGIGEDDAELVVQSMKQPYEIC